MIFDILLQFDNRFKNGLRIQGEPPLKPRELDLLSIVSKEPNQPMAFYANHVHLEQGSFTYLVDVLIKKKLIERKEDPEDKRKRTIILTGYGEYAVRNIFIQIESYQSEVLNRFTKEEKIRLFNALDTFRDLIDTLPAEKERELK